MHRVVGLGGIFFKAKEPEKLYQWYEKHLGIKREPDGSGAIFTAREPETGKPALTIWAIFPSSTRYFEPSTSSFMLNFRVDDMESLLKALREEGVEIDPKQEDYPYGRFAWITDPEGNRIELWEPK